MTTSTKTEIEETISIHPKTAIGLVALTVADLPGLLEFYQQALGLQLNWQAEASVGLGVGGQDLLQLYQRESIRRYRGVTGLYHFALLYPGRRELARAIARLFQLRYANYPTDHILTKSTYLDDPEGNGIELYTESPEDGWWNMESGSFGAIRADGSWSDGREPLDLEALFQHLEPAEHLDSPSPAGTRMGHVHLHVGDLNEALDFYHRLLGFDVMGIAKQVGAAFVSAGGYHHHIGLNTWQGEYAPTPPSDAAGLRHFTILLPEAEEFARLKARLEAADYPCRVTDDGILLADPSTNGILLRLS
jgi:catechol 2,3-dioxygenase